MSVSIRSASPSEISGIAELYWSVWHETQAALQPPAVAAFRTLVYFEERVAGFPNAPLGGYLDGQLIGFSAWEDDYLVQLFVRSDVRRAGLGRQLLGESEAAIWDSGFSAAWLNCIVGNVIGRAFYERCGWVVASTLDEETETAAGPVKVAVWRMVKRRLG